MSATGEGSSGRLPSGSGRIPSASGRIRSTSGHVGSASGRIAGSSGRIRTDGSGRLSSSGTIRQRGSSTGAHTCGPTLLTHGGARAGSDHRPRWALRIGLAGLLGIVASVAFALWPSADRTPADVPGLPATYEMRCTGCQMRFEMGAVDYRRELANRSDKTANRIDCPKCGAKAAAYRTQSGMEGLGEITPNGEVAEKARYHPEGRSDD